MLSVRGLECRLAGRPVLQQIDLDILPGEVLAVLGPNGAGKSSLLRVLAGELHWSAGTVAYADQPLRQLRPRQLAALRAVLPQQLPQLAGLSVAQVVALGCAAHAPAQRGNEAALVQAALASLDAAHLAQRDIGSLSGGECQRVHLARAWAQLSGSAAAEKYLLLDEPTTGLDPAHQLQLLACARDAAHRHGWGVVMVLHDLNLAAAHADRVALLQDGRVLVCDAPQQAIDADLLTALYGMPLQVLAHPLAPARPLVVFPVAE